MGPPEQGLSLQSASYSGDGALADTDLGSEINRTQIDGELYYSRRTLVIDFVTNSTAEEILSVFKGNKIISLMHYSSALKFQAISSWLG